MHLEYMRVLDDIVERSATRGESGVLLYLYHVDRPMYPGELTEKLGLTTGRIANILKELERERLILRTPDVLDKRRVRVALTPEGEALARRRKPRSHTAFTWPPALRLRDRTRPSSSWRCSGAWSDRSMGTTRAVDCSKGRAQHLFKAHIPSIKRFLEKTNGGDPLDTTGA